MSNRDDFIAVVKRVKSALSNITNDQQRKLLTQARQDHKLTRQEATKILGNEGLTANNVNNVVNYFEVLDLDMKVIESLSEDEIRTKIRTKADKLYNKYSADSGNPLIRKKLDLIAEARDTLLQKEKRQEHINTIKPRPKHVDLLFTFATTDIAQLTSLMKDNYSEATQILYSGNLAKCLSGTHLADAAKSVVSEFKSNKSMGMKAMDAILRDKIKLKSGGEVSTRQDIARLIDQDQNWDEAKVLLYDGFFTFWFEHTNQTRLANTAKSITTDHPFKRDRGLEKFVQELDPQIGKPKPEVSESEIDFGKMNPKDKDIIQIEIKNKGRGFLYGEVEIESSLPGLQISNTEINGTGVISVALDASSLASRKTHKTSLVVKTDGEQLKIPISCYVDNFTQRAVQQVAKSGLSMAGIAFVTRLIIQQFGSSGWLGTHLTGADFTSWTQHWQWVEWFQWPWFKWTVYTLGAPGAGLGFIIALASFGAGIFGYWYFILKKKE